jgi:ribosomal protein S16
MVKIDAERTRHWIERGAQPTDTVRSLLAKAKAQAQ